MASFVRMGQEIPVAPVPVSWQEQDWAERLEKTIERGANHLPFHAGRGRILAGRA